MPLQPQTRSHFLSAEETQTNDQFILFFNNKIVVKQGRFRWDHEQVSYFISDESQFIVVDYAEIGGGALILCRLHQDISEFLQAELRSLRELVFKASPIDFALAGKATQLLEWYNTHRYCGSCGSENTSHERDRALVCSACKRQYFPRINPCVIMLITRGSEMLLARHNRPGSDFFSCLAGFIEPGETPEECVHREVQEEVGLQVENVRYYKSQSWPFPSQLMLGYYADYKSGDIVLEDEEIAEANWYSYDSIPKVPSASISVAGELIRDWCQSKQGA